MQCNKLLCSIIRHFRVYLSGRQATYAQFLHDAVFLTLKMDSPFEAVRFYIMLTMLALYKE